MIICHSSLAQCLMLFIFVMYYQLISCCCLWDIPEDQQLTSSKVDLLTSQSQEPSYNSSEEINIICLVGRHVSLMACQSPGLEGCLSC